MVTSPDPFRTLGIEATLDRAVIKRAYFGMLRQHPPHADPDGFRRIRDAYERLLGDGLAAAWATAELDLEHELRAVEAQLGARVEAAQRAARALDGDREVIAAFTAITSLTLDAAVARCGSVVE